LRKFRFTLVGKIGVGEAIMTLEGNYGIEGHFVGSKRQDILIDNDGNDMLEGGIGADQFNCGEGTDMITGFSDLCDSRTTDCEFIFFFLDSDILVNPDTLTKLFIGNMPIISAVYYYSRATPRMRW
jgi:Ca2+-binding RTX toxin-like protein